MLLGIPHVVDVNFIQAVLIELVKVWTALRILKRDEVGDQGHEVLTPGLIAAKHVEVRAVYLGLIGDEGSFAMARCQRRQGKNTRKCAC